jgi:hypothetical protein
VDAIMAWLGAGGARPTEPPGLALAAVVIGPCAGSGLAKIERFDRPHSSVEWDLSTVKQPANGPT